MRFGADFDALIARFSPQSETPLTLAVSGGGDSMALLLLTHDWAKRTGRKLQVLTVDHQLRAEAAQEAAHVKAICQDFNLAHETLRWQSPKASQSAARRGRYDLLCTAAHAAGASTILVGHTQDDVIETALIRRRRGVRDTSLAGPVMASPAPVWPAGRDMTLLRPLLSETRYSLRELLKAKDVNWIDDPSNEKTDFERVRVRQFLDRHPRLSLIAREAVAGLQADRALQDQALGARLSDAKIHEDGLIEITDEATSPRLLSLLARCASGTDREPRGHAVTEMIESLEQVGQRQTLGGAWFQNTKTGYLIGRDPGEACQSADLDLFDGRFAPVKQGHYPSPEAQSFLMRQTAPPGPNWQEIISMRIAHIARCYQTPRLRPVQTYPPRVGAKYCREGSSTS